MKNARKSGRRLFLKQSAVTTTGMALGLEMTGTPFVSSALGANDRIRMGFIGVGNRGSQLLSSFMKNRDVEIAALCDVYEPYTLRDRSKVCGRFLDELGERIPAMGETFSGKVERYKDFRRLIDRKDIDAVCIATPDHWHAVQAIMAMESGKDVYVEKPLTITIHEGRTMVEAASRTNRVTQVGLNRRGAPVYQELAGLVRSGKIGKVTVARAYHVSNMYPDGIGKAQPENPPEGFDWDMWLGPRPFRPYQYTIAPYKFRWWKSYSSQIGNWGVHYLDVIRWLIGEQAPSAVSTHGGKYVIDDDRTIPDTMEVTFEFGSGAVVIFGLYEAGGGNPIPGWEVELCGVQGTLSANERVYKIVPPSPGQFQKRSTPGEPVEKRLETPVDSTDSLVRNFLDCVKSRSKSLCDMEEGHRSTTFAHLANIALETKTRIEWDPKTERITNNSDANNLLHYQYREPWKL
ncbi:Gfo/Idh/MocA family oxidoreductase [bacterium]|nr:Gfo/Idh/MocA family oxidoreductase [bacterium]